jgi:hypothetical protein
MKFLIALVLIFGCTNALFAGVPDERAISIHEISLGYPAYQKVVRFKIDDAYKPEIHETFFRIFVDYPSMRPTRGPRKFKLNDDTLEILVQAYPKYGTNADKILSGGFGAIEIAPENGYRVFTERIGRIEQTKIYGYKDETGSVIVSDPGSWSVRYAMTRGVSDLYQFNCHFSKKMGAPFKSIDESVVRLLSTMIVE